jgi:uncharacterized delta-60 repeat protein
MWPILSSLWFTLSSRAASRAAARRRPAARPKVEALEDRCLLSAGALDPTFGNGAGYVTTVPSSSGGCAAAVLAQPDGKLLAVGGIMAPVSGKPNSGIHDVFGVARYNTDGSLDTSFGSGGLAQASFGPNNAYCEAAARQPDGKIVLEGWYYVPVGSKPSSSYNIGEIALARFNPNGTLDTTFGSGGEVLTSFTVGTTPLSVTSRGVVLTSTGQIVAVADNGSDIVLARYNANGTLDPTFGTGGKVITTFPSVTYEENLAQQPDGKLVVVGETGPDSSHYAWHIVRYNANGSLDATFGTGGVVTTSFASSSYGSNVAIYPNAGTSNDSKILVVGQGAVARYNGSGTLDPTFGTGGEVLTSDWNTVVAISADGKPVVAGGTPQPGLNLARYNVDGTPDTTFGTGGVVTTTIGINVITYGMAIESNGDIAVAGAHQFSALSQPHRIFVVARYLASEPQVGSFTASPNPVLSGSSLTLTASGITDANPNTTITQVAFYVQVNGVNTLLGYGTQTSPGVWTFSFTVSLAPGTYTLFAQAEDSYGVFGDLCPLALQVL